MLHRRTQFEIWSGAVIPTGFFASNSFEVGPGAGFKASIETSKDLFVGVEFDWANWQQGEGASKFSENPDALANLRPDQLVGVLKFCHDLRRWLAPLPDADAVHGTNPELVGSS